jgi:hypothetical protein
MEAWARGDDMAALEAFRRAFTVDAEESLDSSAFSTEVAL